MLLSFDVMNGYDQKGEYWTVLLSLDVINGYDRKGEY